MNRRTVLRAVTTSTVVVAGCLAGSPAGSTSTLDATASDSPAETTTSTSPETDRSEAPRDWAFPYDVTAALSADCPRPTVEFLGTESVAAVTTAGTETPHELHDYVEVRLRTESTGEFELMGCIDSVEKGRVGVSETVAGDTEYERRFGPFTHHGVNRVERWVPGCDLRRRWPRGA